jgi:CheY-like chemotaxis protein
MKRANSSKRIEVELVHRPADKEALNASSFRRQIFQLSDTRSQENDGRGLRRTQSTSSERKTGPRNGRSIDLRIMVVDDEKKIADLYSIILRSAGFTVSRIVQDGMDAVEAVKSDPANCPDVILMDQKMSRMDGLEASTRIKKFNPDVKIIMITAYDVPSSYRNLMSHILLKPISKHQLIEAIGNV